MSPRRADREIAVTTEVGDGLLLWRDAQSAEGADAAPAAVLVLGHGAGGQLDALDLLALARGLPERGIAVARFEQPWKTAGRRISAPAPQLDLAWQAAVAAVRQQAPGAAVLVGGRSQGARVACRTADAVGAVGVVCLAFPLHPPGRPERSRLAELLTPTVPVLVCQGSRDTFGTAADLRAAIDAATASATEGTIDASNIRITEITGADHSMRTRKADPVPQAAVGPLVRDTVADFVTALARR